MPYPQVPKPRELTDLHGIAEALFDVLRETYEVPLRCPLPLDDVDDAGAHDDLRLVAALAMWEARALRLAAAPETRVLNADVVRTATVLHSAIEKLIPEPETGGIVDLLYATRENVNRAAQIVADLGFGHDGGIVELT